MKSRTRRKGVVTLKDVDELDAIIEESRKILALTKITECITETKPGWNGSPWQLILERART